MSSEPTPHDPPTPAGAGPGSGIDFTDPHAPLAPFYLQTSHVVAVVLLAGVFLFFSLVPPLFHTDFWGHLKYGEWIVQHRALPEAEPFSAYADRSRVFVDFQWLTQVAYCLLFRAGAWLAGGDDARQLAGSVEFIRAGHALLLTLRFGLLLLAYRRLSGSRPLACVALGAALAFGLTYNQIQRPQVMGEVGFAALLALVSAARVSAATLVGIPVLMALWANCHGSFLVGFGLLGLATVGRWIEAARRPAGWSWTRAWQDRDVRLLAAALAAAVVAVAFLNPYGPALYRHVLDLAANANVRQMAEWQPMFSGPPDTGRWLYVVLTLLVVVTQLMARQRPTPTALLLGLTFGLAPLWQQRHFIWWVMLAPWLMVAAGQAVAARRGWNWLQEHSLPSLRKSAVAVGVVVLAAVWSSPVQLLVGQEPLPVSVSMSRATPYFVMPKISAALAARDGQQGISDGIWTSETLADYWLWALPDARRLFVYSHVHVFTPEHWAEHTTVLFGSPGWNRVLERHGINLVMVEPEVRPELAEQLRRDAAWQILLDESGIREKRDPRMRLLVALRRQPL